MFQGVYGYWATARDWANKQYMLALTVLAYIIETFGGASLARLAIAFGVPVSQSASSATASVQDTPAASSRTFSRASRCSEDSMLSCSGDGGGSVEGGGQAEAVSEGGRLEDQQQLAQDFAHDNNELHRENESLREELSSTRELVQRLEEDRQRDQATMQDLRTHTQTLQRGLSQGGGSPQRALASREEAEALLMVIVFGYISGVFRR